MLDHAKVLRELHNVTQALFLDFSSEYSLAQQTWQEIIADETFAQKAHAAVEAPWMIPSWTEPLGTVHGVERSLPAYQVGSIDGSQIYPDRHQGTSCFLVNIGVVQLRYGLQGRAVELESRPIVYTGDVDGTGFDSSTDMVNCLRQEHEFKAGFALSKKMRAEFPAAPFLFFFDGSLVFWHLDGKEVELKDRFLSSYLGALHQFYVDRIPLAGYISLPKSKELVNLIRLKLCNFDFSNLDEQKSVDHVVDAAIAQFFLEPFTRSVVFKSNAKVCEQYPDHVRPHFFYLHAGNEVGRVEIPAWIARDTALLNNVTAMIVDQIVKGRGFPVALAEAHEQAVVKGPDRDFFYHMICKLGIEQRQRILLSQKSLKKRGIGI